MATLPPSLRKLLGDDPHAVTADHLEQLRGTEEGQHLELKLTLDLKGQDPKRELAEDLVALANGGGGVLLIGVDEADGQAAGVAGVDGSEALALQVEQVIGTRVQPPLPYTLARTAVAGGREVLVLAVEAGPLRPHAVVDGARLRYPVRRGRGKDSLSEPEVADRYALRFASADQRAAELDRRHVELVDGLDLDRLAWTAMTLVPSTPGLAPVHMADVEETAQWLRQLPEFADVYRSPWNARPAYRAVRAFSDYGNPTRLAVLAEGGAGSIAHASHTEGRVVPSYWRSASARAVLMVEQLLVLTAHARRRGATGTADVVVQIVAEGDCSISTGPGHRGPHHIEVMPGPPDFYGTRPPRRRTFDLTGLPDDPTALLQVAHMLTLDIISDFETFDAGVIDEHGHVHQAVADNVHQAFAAWARSAGATWSDPALLE